MSGAVYRSQAAETSGLDRYRVVLDGWPTPKTELRLATRQEETFVIACGPDEAASLVLLHGAQSNAASWMFDVLAWSRVFRCYAVDLIGEPGFSAASRPPLNGDAHALWFDEVMSGLGLKRAAFVGVSFGGWLALYDASRRPMAVERAALMCPAGIGRQKNFLSKAALHMLLGRWGAQRVRQMVFGEASGEPPPAATPLIDLLGLIAGSVRPRVVQIPRLSNDELSRVAAALLVIVGGRDVLLDSDHTRQRLLQCKPEAEVVYLPEARHAIVGQAERILAFLQAGSATPSRAPYP